MSSSYYTADRSDLLEFLRPFGPRRTALDIGCAAGRLGRQLLDEGLVTRCDGVEPHAGAAEQARRVLSRVWELDFSAALEQVPWQEYELLVLADVLEHLNDPWAALAALHSRVRPGTRLAISVPNVRHKSVVFPLLLQGRFEYAEAGIMDRTHLHFFTRSSLNAAVTGARWRVLAERPNIKRKYLRWWFPHRLLGDFLAVQCFLLAEK